MKRNIAIIIAIVVACGVATGYKFAGADGGAQPPRNAANAETAKTPSSNLASPFGPAAQATSEAGSQPPAQQAPEPVTPSAPAVAPIPAPIAKELAKARAETPIRPMTQLAKNWFGCATEDGYNTTLALIRQKSASSADHFH